MGFRFFRKKGETLGGKELPHLAKGLNSISTERKEATQSKSEPISGVKSPNKLPSLPDISNINVKKDIEIKKADMSDDFFPLHFKTVPEESMYKNTSFSNLMQHLSKEETLISKRVELGNDGLLSRNLLQEMKTYWRENKEVIKIDLEGKKLEREILNKIRELQKLEIEWQKRQLAMDDMQQNLSEIEIKLDSKIRELRKIFSKLEFMQEVPEENYFYLKDGKILKNLQELSDALLNMDDSVFYHHVTKERNDFANWIKDIIKDSYLAEQLLLAKTKEQTIKVLSG